jgi:hypothetical protein
MTAHRAVPPHEAKVKAYASATGLSPYDASLPGRSETAWNHPAVLELIGLFYDRNEREISRRIRMRYATLIEDLTHKASGEGVEIDDKVKAADTVIKYLKMVSAEDQADRKVREKRAGGKRAAERNVTNSNGDPARLAGFVRMMREKYPDQLAALTAEERADENGVIE